MTIDPPSFSVMSGIAYCVPNMTPSMLMRYVRAQSSSVCSKKGFASAIPALLTRISNLPHVASTSANTSSQLERDVTSCFTAMASPPCARIDSTTLCTPCSLISVATRYRCEGDSCYDHPYVRQQHPIEVEHQLFRRRYRAGSAIAHTKKRFCSRRFKHEKARLHSETGFALIFFKNTTLLCDISKSFTPVDFDDIPFRKISIYHVRNLVYIERVE